MDTTSQNGHSKGIAVFLLISFVPAWILWWVIYRIGIQPLNPMFQFALLPSGFCPALAAIVVRKWITKEGFADSGLKPHFSKWPYYLFAWFWTAALAGIIVGLAYLFQIAKPDFSGFAYFENITRTLNLDQGIPAEKIKIFKFAFPIQTIFMTPVAAFIIWGEEFGWRSYLQIRLLANRPALSALAVGLIWGFWHYPLILMGYQYPDHRLVGLAVFPVSTVLLSIILGWLRNQTQSIWPVCLAHASINTLGGSWLMIWFFGHPDYILLSILGVLGWIPMVILCAWILIRKGLNQTL